MNLNKIINLQAAAEIKTTWRTATAKNSTKKKGTVSVQKRQNKKNEQRRRKKNYADDNGDDRWILNN